MALMTNRGWFQQLARLLFSLIAMAAAWQQAYAGSLYLSMGSGSTPTFEYPELEGSPHELPRMLSASLEFDTSSLGGLEEVADSATLRLGAPEGHLFSLSPTAPATQTFRLLFEGVSVSEGTGISGATVTFINASGEAPVFSDPFIHIVTYDPTRASFMVTASVTGDFTFTELEIQLAIGGVSGEIAFNESRIRMSVYDSNYQGPDDLLPELISVAPIPEPGGYALVGGLALLWASRRRRRA